MTVVDRAPLVPGPEDGPEPDLTHPASYTSTWVVSTEAAGLDGPALVGALPHVLAALVGGLCMPSDALDALAAAGALAFEPCRRAGKAVRVDDAVVGALARWHCGSCGVDLAVA